MLAHLSAERLEALVGDTRTRSGTWHVKRGDFDEPQLHALQGPYSTLFVTTLTEVEGRPRVIVIATVDEPVIERTVMERDVFAGGEARLHDVDITQLLGRIGCFDVYEYEDWVRVPRTLTRTDVDLLRYTLRLPPRSPAEDPSRSPPPQQVGTRRAAPDPVAERLLAAVHGDPASDDNRLVYADYLIERGDVRGELIALQVPRARTGGEPSDRERELLRRHAHEWAQPLASYLMSYAFRRGFIAECMVGDRSMIPPSMLGHPAWSTVESIETRNIALITHDSLRSLVRAATTRSELCRLATVDRKLPLEAAVGMSFVPPTDGVAGRRPVAGGIALPSADDAAPVHERWRAVLDVGALVRLRALGVAIGDVSSVAVEPIRDLLASRLGRQLEHVDVLSSGALADIAAQPLRRFLDASSRLLRLGLRGAIAPAFACLALDRGARGIRLVLQLDREPAVPALRAVFPTIALLGRGLRKIEVQVVGTAATAGDLRWVESLRAELGPVFPDVVLPTAVTRRWLSP